MGAHPFYQYTYKPVRAKVGIPTHYKSFMVHDKR